MEERQDKWGMVSDIDCAFDRQFQKIKGLARVFFCEREEETRQLQPDQANGICYILEDIAEDIKALKGKVDDLAKCVP